jgi:hypothetical protein
MKTDLNGCSTAVLGEQYEMFKHKNKNFYQYDYRHSSGMLFSCVRDSLIKCRIALALWLVTNNLP